MMCYIDMDVLQCSGVSCSKLCLMMEIAWSTGTVVQRDLHIIRCNAFPFPKCDGFDLVHKILGILDVMRECPINSLIMLANSFATI